jgi:hypothetical protein
MQNGIIITHSNILISQVLTKLPLTLQSELSQYGCSHRSEIKDRNLALTLKLTKGNQRYGATGDQINEKRTFIFICTGIEAFKLRGDLFGRYSLKLVCHAILG